MLMLPHRIEQKVPPATNFCLRCRVKLTRRLTHVLTGPVPKLDSSAGIECTNSKQSISANLPHIPSGKKKENASSMFTKAAHSHGLQKDEERKTKKKD